MSETVMQIISSIGIGGAIAVLVQGERLIRLGRKLLARADETVSLGHRSNAIQTKIAAKLGVDLSDVPAELDEAAAEKKAASEIPDATPELVEGFRIVGAIAAAKKPGA